MVVNRCDDHGNSYQEKHLIGLIKFRGLAHYCHDWMYGVTQAVMVLEK